MTADLPDRAAGRERECGDFYTSGVLLPHEEVERRCAALAARPAPDNDRRQG